MYSPPPCRTSWTLVLWLSSFVLAGRTDRVWSRVCIWATLHTMSTRNPRIMISLKELQLKSQFQLRKLKFGIQHNVNINKRCMSKKLLSSTILSAQLKSFTTSRGLAWGIFSSGGNFLTKLMHPTRGANPLCWVWPHARPLLVVTLFLVAYNMK